MQAPIVIKPIPPQVINEGAAFGPVDLKQFIQVAEGSPAAQFTGVLEDGHSLPTGLICTADGLFTGIPAKNTQGTYEVVLTAENAAGSIQTTFLLTIKPSLSAKTTEYLDKLKAQIWEALGQNLPIPELEEIYDRPISDLEIYHLLERWGTLKIWDAFNLDPPGELVLLNLEGASPHYHVYDRGSCLIGVPKDLFSHERTVNDGLLTARAMAREVYKRNWTVELVGFDKFVRGAWVELQHLGDKHGKDLEVINFSPSPEDVRLYHDEAIRFRMD